MLLARMPVPTSPSMQKKAKIYVAGHTGLIGSALVRKLKEFPSLLKTKSVSLKSWMSWECIMSREAGRDRIHATSIFFLHATYFFPRSSKNDIDIIFREGPRKKKYVASILTENCWFWQKKNMLRHLPAGKPEKKYSASSASAQRGKKI